MAGTREAGEVCCNPNEDLALALLRTELLREPLTIADTFVRVIPTIWWEE
jgi:hypothetical protein